MIPPGHDDLRDRLRRALPPAMKARDRPAVTALRSALAAIDNAGAVDPTPTPPADQAPADQAPPDQGLPDRGLPDRPQASAQLTFAGTVAGVGATEVERRSLSQAQMEAIVRAEIADRETAATGYERAGQPDRAERLRAEAEVLLAHLDTT
jgi:uncharacterized protein